MSSKATLLLLAVLLAVFGVVALGLSWAADMIGTAIVLGALGGGVLAAAGACTAGYLVVQAVRD